MEDQAQFCDKPNKEQKHPHFEHRSEKLCRKNNEFSKKKFQRVRRVSTKRNLIKSFMRISTCLNNKEPSDIPTAGLENVCFILVNNFEHDKHDPQNGAMNDGYLMGLNHHRFGFKVFYLRNCSSQKFQEFLEFFMKNTLKHLTVFYSGHDSLGNGGHGIEFKDNSVPCSEYGKIISENYNGRCKVVFISDSIAGGSVFDISSLPNDSDVISFSVTKSTNPESKEGRRSHGIFTYYLCKIFKDDPDISPERLAERMNPSLQRFNETFVCDVSNQDSKNESIYSTD